MNYPEDFIDKIILGDCLEVMKDIPDETIDFILADLPMEKTGGKWDSIIPFAPLWEQYNRIIRNDGAIALFGVPPFSSLLVCSNLDMFRYRWVWDKVQGGNWQLAKLQPLNTAEDICIFSKAKTANGASLNMRYFPIKIEREKSVKAGGKPSTTDYLHPNNMIALHNEYHDKFPTSIITFKKPTGKDRVHPTQKPVELCEYLIKTYTLEGELVLDNVIGSGTTAEACLRTNRHFIGIDNSEKYCQIAKDRIDNFQMMLL